MMADALGARRPREAPPGRRCSRCRRRRIRSRSRSLSYGGCPARSDTAPKSDRVASQPPPSPRGWAPLRAGVVAARISDDLAFEF